MKTKITILMMAVALFTNVMAQGNAVWYDVNFSANEWVDAVQTGTGSDPRVTTPINMVGVRVGVLSIDGNFIREATPINSTCGEAFSYSVRLRNTTAMTYLEFPGIENAGKITVYAASGATDKDDALILQNKDADGNWKDLNTWPIPRRAGTPAYGEYDDLELSYAINTNEPVTLRLSRNLVSGAFIKIFRIVIEKYNDVAAPSLIIGPEETKTKEDYLAGGYGDIIFKSNETSTGQLIIPEGEELEVNGVVKLQKTFITGRWYPIGFPFDVNTFYCDDLEDDSQGDNGVLDIYGSKEAGEGDFWVKEYKGATNLFDYVTRIESGKGYIIQFPPAFEDNEVTFISDAKPVLKNTTALSAELADNAYTLVANPSTANVSSMEEASNYYLYNSTGNQFSLLEGTAPALKPFEALIVVKNPVTPLRTIYVEEQGTGCKPINTGDQLLETRYYNLQGIEIPKPEANGIFIAKKIYTSGKVEIVKTCVNKK